MATTTNYSWTTPNDTDLVKNGASAIRTLGSAIDTTTKNLNPSTTLGDIEYRSSTANTNTRLGIGTTGQVLTVSGGVPAWSTPSSGGMTLISTTTMSGASLTLSSIPSGYVDLYLIIRAWLPANDGSQPIVSFNGDTTANRHYYADSGPTFSNTAFNNTIFAPSQGNDNAVSTNLTTIQIPDYSNTTTMKMARCKTVTNNSTTPTNINSSTYDAYYNQTSAITSLSFQMNSGNMTSGTILLYGVK